VLPVRQAPPLRHVQPPSPGGPQSSWSRRGRLQCLLRQRQRQRQRERKLERKLEGRVLELEKQVLSLTQRLDAAVTALTKRGRSFSMPKRK